MEFSIWNTNFCFDLTIDFSINIVNFDRSVLDSGSEFEKSPDKIIIVIWKL